MHANEERAVEQIWQSPERSPGRLGSETGKRLGNRQEGLLPRAREVG